MQGNDLQHRVLVRQCLCHLLKTGEQVMYGSQHLPMLNKGVLKWLLGPCYSLRRDSCTHVKLHVALFFGLWWSIGEDAKLCRTNL